MGLLILIIIRRLFNHTETIERIICHDKKHLYPLFSSRAEAQVRRLVKFSPHKILFVLDGFDELNDRDKEVSVICQILKGKVAPGCGVITTTRPHCLTEIKDL